MKIVLIDTDVILDFFFDRKSFSDKDFRNSTLGVMTPENYLKIKIAEQK